VGTAKTTTHREGRRGHGPGPRRRESAHVLDRSARNHTPLFYVGICVGSASGLAKSPAGKEKPRSALGPIGGSRPRPADRQGSRPRALAGARGMDTSGTRGRPRPPRAKGTQAPAPRLDDLVEGMIVRRQASASVSVVQKTVGHRGNVILSLVFAARPGRRFVETKKVPRQLVGEWVAVDTKRKVLEPPLCGDGRKPGGNSRGRWAVCREARGSRR